MYKMPSGARFITASKKCINMQLSKHVTSAFKLYYSQIDAYHKKSILFQWEQNVLGTLWCLIKGEGRWNNQGARKITKTLISAGGGGGGEKAGGRENSPRCKRFF